MSISNTLVFNDPHRPFHDPKAVDVMLEAVYDNYGKELDRIVINGDLLDMYNVNMHGPKHPDIITTLEDELDDTYEFLCFLRKLFPKTHIVFIFGNHEDRLDRFILKNCKAFTNILKIENQLQLERLGIEYYTYNQAYQLEKSNLFIQHSPPSYSKNAAMVSLERKLDASFIYGCTHRLQHAVRTGITGKLYHVYLNGWLGSSTLTKEHRRVFSYAKGHENWQQGFSIVTIENKKQFYVNQVTIEKGKCLLNGHIYG